MMTHLKLNQSTRGCLRRTLLTALALVLIGPSVAHADYHIATGDVLELSVAGVPELKQRVVVNIDGDIVFAPLGRFHVSGLSIAELESQVQQNLSKKLYFQRTSEGRENRVILEAEAITVTVAEYRPVYVNGDVSKPGEQQYRPGMTVRQALAVAGGFNLFPNRVSNPFVQAADIRSEHEVLVAQLEREQAYIDRLKLELDIKEDAGSSSNRDTSVEPRRIAKIADLQAQQLTARKADYENEKNYLQVAIQQSSKRLTVLLEQQKKEQEGEQADAEDMQRVEGLFQRGAVPITRITEARRVGLLSSTRRLETSARVAQVEREREDFQRRLQKLDDQRRIDLMKELDDANLKLTSIRSRLHAASEKLLYTGAVKLQVAGAEASKPDIVVFRKTGGVGGQLAADASTELQPGDVIEVTVKREVEPGASEQ
jgi:polysaccharide export outer membrane protein